MVWALQCIFPLIFRWWTLMNFPIYFHYNWMWNSYVTGRPLTLEKTSNSQDPNSWPVFNESLWLYFHISLWLFFGLCWHFEYSFSWVLTPIPTQNQHLYLFSQWIYLERFVTLVKSHTVERLTILMSLFHSLSTSLAHSRMFPFASEGV